MNLKENLSQARKRMKQLADKGRVDREFQMGDLVLSNWSLTDNIQKFENHKLTARFFGPYEMEVHIGKVAYQIKLLAEAKIHNIFHVSHS